MDFGPLPFSFDLSFFAVTILDIIYCRDKGDYGICSSLLLHKIIWEDEILALWIVATIAAYFVKGLCGFANTLVFTSILSFGENNVIISPVELILGYPTNLILAWTNRRKINIRIFLPLAVLVLAGSIPGAILLKNMNTQYLKILFGAVVVLIGIEMLVREYKLIQTKGSKILLGLIGLLSGLLCGLFGIGALLAAYVGRVTNTTDEFKGNISAVFIVENTVRIILYSFIGVITFNAIKYVVILMPFMLAGLYLGMKSAKILDERIIKKLVIILLIISGLVLIYYGCNFYNSLFMVKTFMNTESKLWIYNSEGENQIMDMISIGN